MLRWSDPQVRDDVVRLAKLSTSSADHLARVREYFGDASINIKQIENAWRQWRTNDGIPLRSETVSYAHGEGRKWRKGSGVSTVCQALDHVVDGEVPKSGTVIITSDHHHPISDRAAEAAIVAFARDAKPFAWVFNGDILDAWMLSSFDKEASRLVDGQTRIVDEVASFKPLAIEASRICKHVWIGEGNHEQRLARTINIQPGLHGLPGLSWSSIFGLGGNVRYLDHGYRLKLGPVQVMHGDKVHGRHPAQWALDNHGARSVIFGHTHRLSVASKTTWEEKPPRTVVAINGGHLSDPLRQRYMFEPNWQCAFVVLQFFTVAGKPRYSAHPVMIVDGRFAYGGKTYDGNRSQ